MWGCGLWSGGWVQIRIIANLDVEPKPSPFPGLYFLCVLKRFEYCRLTKGQFQIQVTFYREEKRSP